MSNNSVEGENQGVIARIFSDTHIYRKLTQSRLNAQSEAANVIILVHFQLIRHGEASVVGPQFTRISSPTVFVRTESNLKVDLVGSSPKLCAKSRSPF